MTLRAYGWAPLHCPQAGWGKPLRCPHPTSPPPGSEVLSVTQVPGDHLVGHQLVRWGLLLSQSGSLAAVPWRQIQLNWQSLHQTVWGLSESGLSADPGPVSQHWSCWTVPSQVSGTSSASQAIQGQSVSLHKGPWEGPTPGGSWAGREGSLGGCRRSPFAW